MIRRVPLIFALMASAAAFAADNVSTLSMGLNRIHASDSHTHQIEIEDKLHFKNDADRAAFLTELGVSGGGLFPAGLQITGAALSGNGFEQTAGGFLLTGSGNLTLGNTGVANFGNQSAINFFPAGPLNFGSGMTAFDVDASIPSTFHGDLTISGALTATLTGNADTATALAGGHTIGMTGDVGWISANFDGSGNVTGTSVIGASRVTNAMLAGSIADSKLSTISTAGKVSNSATTATNANTANAIVSRDASGNFTAGTITAALSGNASTVTTNANLTGDVSSTGNATTLATVNANVGTWGSATQAPSITLNGKGLATAASNVTITPADSSVTFTDIATGDSATTQHGFLKKLDNNSAHYINGTGAWTTPPGPTSQRVSGDITNASSSTHVSIWTFPTVSGGNYHIVGHATCTGGSSAQGLKFCLHGITFTSMMFSVNGLIGSATTNFDGDPNITAIDTFTSKIYCAGATLTGNVYFDATIEAASTGNVSIDFISPSASTVTVRKNSSADMVKTN